MLTDLEETPKQALKVQAYPNPTLDGVNLTVEYEQITEWKVNIYDYAGRNIISGIILSGSKNFFPLHNAKPGVYIIEVSNNQEIFFREKIIKL